MSVVSEMNDSMIPMRKKKNKTHNTLARLKAQSLVQFLIQ